MAYRENHSFVSFNSFSASRRRISGASQSEAMSEVSSGKGEALILLSRQQVFGFPPQDFRDDPVVIDDAQWNR